MPSASASTPPAALVTGGGSGIGLAIVRRLLLSGHRVVMAGRSEARLRDGRDSLRPEIPDIDDRTRLTPCDVGDADQTTRLVESAVASLGRLDVLVNNAGLAELHTIDASTAAVLRRTFDVNALGTAWAIAAAWPTFRAQGTGCVINISSMATKDPFPGFFAYAAAKASVNLMARSCAAEGRSIGVRAFAVAPGAVETAMLRSMFDARALPASACLTPDEVAAVVMDCVGGRLDARNGETIYVEPRR